MSEVKLIKIKEGPYLGTVVEGPEYETLALIGGLTENNNLG